MSDFSVNLANVATTICADACASSEIKLADVTTLDRTYVLLDSSAKKSAVATMKAIRDGSIKIINDGSGVFDRNGMRVRGT